jgi:5-formyltetrahydrofolate cyclo-ligase
MKNNHRIHMKKRLAGIGPDEARRKSRAACRHLIEIDQFARADAVMVYMPVPGEVDAMPLALAAWQRGKTVLVPKVFWDHKHMVAVTCKSIDDEMVETRYGIREPVGGEVWPIEQVDLIVVPALAFDRAGNRLGRGGGFYDRFLAQPGVRAVRCGLAFREQVVDELPAETHDRPVHLLATDEELLRFDHIAGPGDPASPCSAQTVRE